MTIDALVCVRNKKILHGCRDYRDSKIKHDSSESEAMIKDATSLSFDRDYRKDAMFSMGYHARVLITCPEKAGAWEMLIVRPHSFEELKEIGLKRFGDSFMRVLNEEGAEIDDIRVVRDNDRVVFASQTPVVNHQLGAQIHQSNEDVLPDNRPIFKYPGRKIEDWDLLGVYTLLVKSYLFQGMSTDLYLKLLNGMWIEYFSPNKDVILQNEAPTNFYIIANGAVELLVMKNGVQEVVGEARTGEICGEIGVFCHMPHVFTVRTKRSTQLLRLNYTTILKISDTNWVERDRILATLRKHWDEPKWKMMIRDKAIETVIGRKRRDFTELVTQTSDVALLSCQGRCVGN